MITLKINGKTHKLPTSWQEVTLSQWRRMAESKDLTDNIAIFTGIDRETLLKSQISGLDTLITTLSFTSKVMQPPGYTPTIGPYRLPANSKGQFNIQYESLGQFEDARAAITKTGDVDNKLKGTIDMYVSIIAIYLQKIRDGEYDYLKAKDMEPEIESYPVMEVLSLGSFFLIKQLSLLLGTQKTSRTTPPKKGKKSLKRSSRSSGAMLKSIGSRGR